MTHGTFELGPTGEGGDSDAADSGELVMAVGLSDDRVVLDFSKVLKWVGLAPREAKDLAVMLREKAHELDESIAGEFADEVDYPTKVYQLAGQFDEKAQEAHEQMEAAADVAHTVAYAFQEKVWREAIAMLESVVVDDEDEDTDGDPIDFEALPMELGGGVEDPRKATPEEIAKMDLSPSRADDAD